MNKDLHIAMMVSAALLAARMGFWSRKRERSRSRSTSAGRPDNSQTNEMKRKNMKKSLGERPLATVPVWVVSSYDQEGKPNVMTAAWVGICCSKPPCVTVALRKATIRTGTSWPGKPSP